MQMDNRIILAGQQPDIMGSFARGMEVRANENALAQQNAVADLYRKQGAQILSGDEGALNALAGFDPQAALGIQSQQQQNAYAAEDQQMQRDRFQMDRDNARIATQEALAAKAAELTAEQVAQEAADLEDTLSGAAFFYQNKDQAGYDAFLRSKGADPAEYPFQAFPAHAAKFGGALDAMKTFAPPAGPEPTSSQRDYQFYTTQETAAGRQPMSFNDWDTQGKKAAAASTTVNLGGGPAPETVAAFNKGVKSANVNEVIGDIRNTIAGATFPTTGMVGSALSGVGGTAAGDVKSNVETLKAAASFSSLQAMRDASKTGAALGAVSDTEIKLLSAELANLEQSQSQEQFLRNLERFDRVYNEIVNGPEGAPKDDDGTGIGTVEDGFRYIGGDSSTPEAWEPAQ